VSEKALKALVGVVLGLCLVWLVVNFIPHGSPGAGRVPEALRSFFTDLDPGSVTAVRFTGPGAGGEIELTRAGSQWEVNGFHADSGAVARFWETMIDASVDGLVGRNPANHARLGVSPDSAWTLEVVGSDGSRDILVGKSGSRYGTTYVRLPDADEVYLVEGSLRPIVTRDLESWRNKRVTRAYTGTIRTLDVAADGSTTVLRREDSLWVFDDGEPADGTVVRSLLGQLARMDATGFYGPRDSLPAKAGSVRATDGSGTTLLYLEVGSGDGDRWVRVEGDSIVYRIPSWRAGQLLPTPEDLREGG